MPLPDYGQSLLRAIQAMAARLVLDPTSNSLQVIDFVHHEVHEGDTYQASFKTPDGAPLADNATLEVLIQAGNQPMHTVYAAAAGGDAEIALFEGTTFSAAGTAMPARNMSRLSTNTALATITHTPTTTLDGAQLQNAFLPGGAGGPPSTPGGAARQDTEWVLAPDTNYLLRLTNRSGGAQPASLVVQWYEHALA